MWDAGQYQKFTNERSRPFFDLLAQVTREHASFIADLGCGPGNLTQTLLDRWPMAKVVGVDSSPEMLAKARPLADPGRLAFIQANISTWSSEVPLDLIVSNAALQWVPDHAGLLPRLAAMLSPGGTLAVQAPIHFDTPSHDAIEQTSADPRWATQLAGVGLSRDCVHPVAWYFHTLRKLGFSVNAWTTTYIHVLTGPDPVLEWYKGTALRPLLERLGSQADDFLAALGARFAAAYPAQDGVTLLPFPRLFFVATRDCT